MVTNLLDAGLLARLMQAGATSLLGLIAGVQAVRIVWGWEVGSASERQLDRERRAELVATILQVTAVLQMAGLFLHLAVADRLVGHLRGAMCAFGVFAATPAGFPGLILCAAAAGASLVWWILHRLELRLESPRFTRRKFAAVLCILPLGWADCFAALTMTLQLDFSVVASCCSVWLDNTVVRREVAMFTLPPTWSGILGWGGPLAALTAALALWVRPGPATALATSILGLAAVPAVVSGVLGVAAPYALETPHHPCPFCLLHAQGGYLGWPLLGGLFLAGILTAALAILETQRAALARLTPLAAPRQSLGRWLVAAWTVVLLCESYPVARFWIRTGGASVFGQP